MSEGSGATEDGDDHLGQDYVGGGDDGRYPEKAQLEEAGYRYESALRSCGHGRAQWQVNKYTILYIVRPKKTVYYRVVLMFHTKTVYEPVQGCYC